MLEINLIDQMFSGTSAGSDLDEPNEYIRWVRDHKTHDLAIVTDNSLNDPQQKSFKQKIAWLFESPNPKTSRLYKLRKRWKFRKFDQVFTYDQRLLSCGKKFEFCPLGGSWIPLQDWGVYPKTINTSILASTKNDLPGHQLRHEILNSYGDRIDERFGRPHRFVEHKLDALKDFRYSIIIENQRIDYYFSEKLIDCFAAGTVPIYWGCPSISRFFDPDGIIQFNSADELEVILASLSPEDYGRRLPAIKRNLETAKQFRIPEKTLHDLLLPRADLLKIPTC